MSLRERLAWLRQALATFLAAIGFGRKVAAAMPPAPAGKERDIMTDISVEELKQIAAMLQNGGAAAAAIGKATSGKPGDMLLAASEIAALLPLPQAQAIAMGLKGAEFFVDKILPIIKAADMKAHNTGEGGVGARPEGNSNVVI